MTHEEQRATEIFGLVSNSTRVEILQALASAYRDSPTEPWVEYSTLRDSAAICDNGNFNYHLDRLEDLVVKESPGYRISRLGLEVVAAVASGSLDPEWTWGPVDVPGTCLFCEDPVRLRYRDGNLHLECGTADHSLRLSVAPSLLEAHPEDRIVDLIAVVLHQQITLLHRNICAECHGYVEGEIHLGDVRPEHYHYHGSCRRCGFQHGFPVGAMVLSHPDVLAFFSERGIDVRTEPYWALDFCRPGHETVESTNPFRVRVALERDGETLSLTLDREGDVISSEHADTD